MQIEIERKFLVVSDAWRSQAHFRETIRQGYLAVTEALSIRVRVADESACLTIKTREPGASRQEFEYAVPIAEAEALLSKCGDAIIEKIRHHVVVADRNWTVDEFGGSRAGLVLAECELDAEDSHLSIPDWAGCEVTGDSAYRNEAL